MQNEDVGRIVMLDYDALEVKVVGQKRQDLDATWPVQAAARHFQQQNVLFGAGQVEARSPTAIDPRFCETYVKFWRPLRDAQYVQEGCLPPGATPNPGGSSASAGTASAGTTTAGTTTGSSSTTTTTTTGGTTTTTTTTGGTTTGGGPSCPPPNTAPAPCYDPNSGFPELADYWVWETNPYRCDASCNCGVRTTYPLDPVDSGKVLLIPETNTTYRLAYFDGRNPDGSMNFVVRCTRQGNGSITIQALTAASFSFYTIFTCNSSQGGQPVGTLYRVNDTQGHSCMVNQTLTASGTVVGMTCIP